MKVKSRVNKIPATVVNNYGGGLLVLSIDISDYEFEKNEVLFANYNLCDLISDEQWNIIIKNSKGDKPKKKDKKVKKKKIRKKLIDSDEDNNK